MAKTPKHEKMYANSPKLASDENGKKYIKKGGEENKAPAEDKTPEHKAMYSRHMEEVSSMHDRHLSEREDMIKRQMKEMQGMAPKDSGDEAEQADEGEE